MTRNASQKKAARAYQQSHPTATFPEAMRAAAEAASQRVSLAAPGTILRNSDNGHVAVKAAPSTTAYDWCGFDPVKGSYPLATGQVDGWQLLWGPDHSTHVWYASSPPYANGAVKRDTATGHVAIKSAPEMPAGEWFVFDPVNGGYYTSSASVEAWVDIPT
jgi:hypothetical protein